ncbi:hypothetical protein EXE59_16675 [Nocardioides eburneiflavus]|uniref:Uncharacterized protein n=1 Tax=Nocardioides eburneiflavus TaxID=2518372 RepID=A0A4Z1CH76_9ACTN|nr:CorA family divalent cation transporter [Nocardioides eburneiflavus]TGN65408.1 hypothetical protein EXE59_16675 [Nocardioides eburneiflavus]
MRLASTNKVSLLLLALALAAVLLHRDAVSSTSAGGLAFFFFFAFRGPSGGLVPESWIVGRFTVGDTPVLVALAPEDSVGHAPEGWQPVIAVVDEHGREAWTLMASKTSGVGLTRATQVFGALDNPAEVDGVPIADLVRHRALRIDEASAPTALDVKDPNLQALFGVAVISNDPEQASNRPRWVRDVIDAHQPPEQDQPKGPAGNKPSREALLTLDTSLGAMNLTTYQAREGTVLAVEFTDSGRNGLPADIIAVLCHANTRDFLPRVSEIEEGTQQRESAILDNLVAVGRVEDKDRETFMEQVKKQRDDLGGIEKTARASATMVKLLRQAAVTSAEDERIQSITRSLHAAADDFRDQSRGLVQLAAPLAAEWRGRQDYLEAETARKRSEGVILFATIVAIIIGIPALVAGFFGAAVKPLAKESPVRFSDLLAAAAVVSFASAAFAEAALHRTKRRHWPLVLALRVTLCASAPAVAWASLYKWQGFSGVLDEGAHRWIVGALIGVAVASLILATWYDGRGGGGAERSARGWVRQWGVRATRWVGLRGEAADLRSSSSERQAAD